MHDIGFEPDRNTDAKSPFRRRLLLALTGATVLPLIILAGRILATGLPEVAMLSDHALLELSILRATTLEQLLGPYSRFGFHYPGPALAYLFAPGYALSGCRYLSASVSIALANAVCVVLILWIVRRREGTLAMAWTAAMLLLLVVHLEPSVLASPWNPHSTILAFALTLAAAAALATGCIWALPIAVASGSLCVQSHLVFALALVFAAVPAAVGWIRVARDRSARKRWIAATSTAALVAVVLWTPPAIAELTAEESNLAKIAEFIVQEAPDDGLEPALRAVTYRLAAPLTAPFGNRTRSDPQRWTTTVSYPLAVGILCLLIAGVVVARRRGARFPAWLCAVCLMAAVAAFLVTMAIPGGIHDYLVRWISALGAMGVAAAGMALGPAASRRVTRGWRLAGIVSLSLALFALTIAAIVQVSNYRDIEELQRTRAGTLRLTRAAAALVEAVDAQNAHLHISGDAAWPHAAAVFTRLAKDAREPTVPGRWAWMFGKSEKPAAIDTLLSVAIDGDRRYGSWSRLAVDESVELAAFEPTLLPEDGVSIGDPTFEPFLIDGFYSAEGAGESSFRWSKGQSSALILPLRKGVACRLWLEIAPLSVPGEEQQLEVEINGAVIGIASLVKPGWRRAEFEVPVDLAHRLNHLAFRYTVVRSPAELGRSGDRRRLGVRFRRIGVAAPE